MTTIREKLKFITEQFNKFKEANIFKVEECIKDRVEFYNNRAQNLDNVSSEALKAHDFKAELISTSIRKQKEGYIDDILDRVFRLEVHTYAPELNKAQFIGKEGTFVEVRIPSKTTIEDATAYIIKTMGLDELQNLVGTTEKANNN